MIFSFFGCRVREAGVVDIIQDLIFWHIMQPVRNERDLKRRGRLYVLLDRLF